MQSLTNTALAGSGERSELELAFGGKFGGEGNVVR